MLNLFAKMSRVQLSGGSAWSYLRALESVEQDRIHVHADPQLLGDTLREVGPSHVFKTSFVLPWQHPAPKDHSRAASLKTHDDHGNLQLTIFTHRDGLSVQVDADIDEESGFEHFVEATSNTLTRGKTEPGIIYQILRYYQPDLEPHPRFALAHLEEPTLT